MFFMSYVSSTLTISFKLDIYRVKQFCEPVIIASLTLSAHGPKVSHLCGKAGILNAFSLLKLVQLRLEVLYLSLKADHVQDAQLPE